MLNYSAKLAEKEQEQKLVPMGDTVSDNIT